MDPLNALESLLDSELSKSSADRPMKDAPPTAIPADLLLQPARELIPIDQKSVKLPEVLPMNDATVEEETPIVQEEEEGRVVEPEPAVRSPDLPMNDAPSTETPPELPPQQLETQPPISIPMPATQNPPEIDPLIQEPGAADDDHPEWEVGSSPISSSDESSDSDSSSEDDEGDDAYQLLSIEEQAALLMNADGASDDEDSFKSKGAGSQLRTKNEVPEELIPKPDVTITADMSISKLGSVQNVVDNVVVVNSCVSGDVRRLDTGSVLCLADRKVVGAIAEVFGPVPTPFYMVRFTNAAEVAEAGLLPGTTVFYSEQHSNYVFPRDLRKIKGTDASNLHDEEVEEREMEFSDDEAEKAHKDRLKAKKRGGKMQTNGGSGRGGHSQIGPQPPPRAEGGLSYDDEDEGTYKRLARPSTLANASPWVEAPQEVWSNRSQDRPVSHGGEQFRGRGRGDRSRGDHRGRGRGGFQNQRGNSSGFSQPPQRPQNSTGPVQSSYGLPTQAQAQPITSGFGETAPTMPPSPGMFAGIPPMQSTPGMPPFPNFPTFPTFPQFPGISPHPSSNIPQPGFPNRGPANGMANGMPNGMHINPNFFNQQRQNQNLTSQPNWNGYQAQQIPQNQQDTQRSPGWNGYQAQQIPQNQQNKNGGWNYNGGNGVPR